MRSAICLKQLTYAPTGAVVAAPTASLPEWIGGTRNWDYRFAWTRDAALASRAMNLVGFHHEARDFLHFLREAMGQEGAGVMYTVDGRPVPEEVELNHLAGYRASKPVRIGNAARNQLQLDVIGAAVDVAHLYERFGRMLGTRVWSHVRGIVEQAEVSWMLPDDGIWEPRSGRLHNVHSKLLCWLALDRGAGLAAAFGESSHEQRWRAAAEQIRDQICSQGLDSGKRHFVAAYGVERPDAALLQLALHGFLPDGDPRVAATIDWVVAELGRGPFLQRYPETSDDGVGGQEGAFLLCGFWLVEALALVGRVEEAEEIFRAHVNSANHLGLLAEMVDPSSRQLLGNFPQAFSHLGLINAALRLDLALRLRDEGAVRAPHLVGFGRR